MNKLITIKIKISVGGIVPGLTELELTLEEARELHQQLGELFNSEDAAPMAGTVGDWVAMNPPTATPRGQHEWKTDALAAGPDRIGE